jgi:MscS family membrane protein
MGRMIELLRWSGYPILDFCAGLLLVALLLWILDLIIDRVLRRIAVWTAFSLDNETLDAVHGPIVLMAGISGLGRALRLLTVPIEIAVGDSEQKAQLAREAAEAVRGTGAGWESLALWNLPADSLNQADRLLLSLMILVTGVVVSRLVRVSVDGLGRRQDNTGELAREMRPLLVNVGKVAVMLIVSMVVLGLWDISLTPLLASAGVVGLAVALAAQDSLANFFGGISLFMDQSYLIGDYIVLDGQERGAVEHIGLRSTRLRTRDDVLITIPNAILSASKVVNQSGPRGRFRIRLPVGIAYGSDIEEAESLMLEVSRQTALALDEPAPRVRFRAFGDSGLQLELLCWCKDPSERGRLVHELGKAIYLSFGQAGIQIPYPQLDLHLPDGANWAEEKEAVERLDDRDEA